MGLTTETQNRYALKKCERNILLFYFFIFTSIWVVESESLDMWMNLYQRLRRNVEISKQSDKHILLSHTVICYPE